MPTYTVKAVNRQKPWKSKRGDDMVSYYCVFANEKGDEKELELAQKVSTAAPTVGQKIEGTVEQGTYGPKLKKEYGGGGGGFRGGPRPDDPATRDSIERQVAIKAVAEVYGRAGQVPTPEEVLTMTAAFLDAMRSKPA